MVTTRRAYLAGLAGAASATAGCAGVLGRRTRPVSVLAAGSLQNALLSGLPDAVSAPVEVEAHGSATVARLVADGSRDPDVVALADTALFGTLLDVEWYATVASNALAVAYDPDGDVGARVAGAERWFDPLLDAPGALGRTDPDLDPLGYRTLFALALSEAHYEEPDLAGRLLRRKQVYPETGLLSAFETGGVEAAVVYASMAEERGYPARDLPAAVDLSDPALADRYATTSYTLPGGRTVRGDVVRYGATVRHVREASVEAFEALASEDLLEPHGFVLPRAYPTYTGRVPGALAP
jgi:molybdate/tungstate transport system substrate-binding protein